MATKRLSATVLTIVMTAGLQSGGLAAEEGDPAKGERIFNRCKACHEITEEKNKVGPHLVGLIGRTAGSVEDYKYSDANKESGVVWNEETLFEYLENPKKFIPRTKMAFPGLKDEQDRLDVIAYIKSVSQ